MFEEIKNIPTSNKDIRGFGITIGIILFIILFISTLIYLIRYSELKEKVILNTSLLSLTFILIGYSSYSLVLIRSSYNPPIDENNPENILNFISYLKREQYGYRPLFKGQYFDANVTNQVENGITYKKGKERYEIKEKKFPSSYSKELPEIETSGKFILNIGVLITCDSEVAPYIRNCL